MLVEKIEFDIKWRYFDVGTSFFIPCLNTALAKKQLQKEIKNRNYEAIVKVVVEDGIRGVRVWRI